MFRQAIPLFLLFSFLNSCNYFNSSKVSKNNNLSVIDTVIDYTKVDVYPIFAECENFSENDNQKKCFEQTLIKKISTSIQKNKLIVTKVVNDSILIDVLIDKTGKTSIVKINQLEDIANQLPKIDSIIRQSITDLPSVKPAIKRGVFVNSQYRIAILVKTID